MSSFSHRRGFLTSTAAGLGLAAVAHLVGNETAHADTETPNPFPARTTPVPPRAKHCIFINLFGAPSQHDLYDPKPLLNQHAGQPLPESFTKNVRFAFLQKDTATLF